MNIYNPTSLIYQVINKVNGKSYVGFTEHSLETRKKQHLKIIYNKNSPDYNKLLYKAIRKYGEENFEWSIIYQAWDTEYCYKNAEDSIINELDTKNPKGYNMISGGGPPTHKGKIYKKGKKYFNNGIKEIIVFPGNEPEEFIIGRLPKYKEHMRKIRNQQQNRERFYTNIKSKREARKIKFIEKYINSGLTKKDFCRRHHEFAEVTILLYLKGIPCNPITKHISP